MSTPNLVIPHILQSQAQKEVTANAALDALDQAIAGLLEVDVSAGGTITVDPPAALKCKMLRLTGTLAADAEVVVPDNRKPYFVHNSTAGGDVDLQQPGDRLIEGVERRVGGDLLLRLALQDVGDGEVRRGAHKLALAAEPRPTAALSWYTATSTALCGAPKSVV